MHYNTRKYNDYSSIFYFLMTEPHHNIKMTGRRRGPDMGVMLIMIRTLEKDGVHITFPDLKAYFVSAGWGVKKFTETQRALIRSGLITKAGRFGAYSLTDLGRLTARDIEIELREFKRRQTKILTGVFRKNK